LPVKNRGPRAGLYAQSPDPLAGRVAPGKSHADRQLDGHGSGEVDRFGDIPRERERRSDTNLETHRETGTMCASKGFESKS